MWMCGAIALLAMALTLRVSSRGALWAPLLFAALAPLALGSVILSRFDLWPAALAVVRRSRRSSTARFRLGHALLGHRRRGEVLPRRAVTPCGRVHVEDARAHARRSSASALRVGVFALVFLPFVVLAPGGVWHSVSVQLGRPLQVESLGAALLLVGAPRLRLRARRRDEPRLAECRRHGGGRARRGVDGRAGGRARLDLVVVCARPGDRRRARPRERRGGLRVRRLRQGAVAAVPDLADPRRAARARSARAVGDARCCSRRSC